jgi:hypothetical protein
MRQYHIARQQVLTGIVFGNDPASRSRWVGMTLLSLFAFSFSSADFGLFHQAANFLVQAAPFFTRDVAVLAIFNIGTRELRFVGTGHQLVFDSGLDLVMMSTF